MKTSVNPRLGDVVKRPVSFGIGYHYGIVVDSGDKEVSVVELLATGVRQTPLHGFASASSYSVVKLIKYEFSRSEVVWRAKYLLNGALKYDLLDYNCEHFVTHVAEGKPRSLQSLFGQIVLLSTEFGTRALTGRQPLKIPSIPEMPLSDSSMSRLLSRC